MTSVYISAVSVWLPKSFLCYLWRLVTSCCDKPISSLLRQSASLLLYGASTTQHVIDAVGVGEYINNALFFLFLFLYILCCRPIMEFGDKNLLAHLFLLRGYNLEIQLASVNVMDAQSVCRQVRAL